MNEYEKWAAAFTIFARYPGEGGVTAQSDIVHAGPSPGIVTATDKASLAELGWRANEAPDFDCWYKFT